MKPSDIIKHLKGIFERKKKNPIQLDNDSNLESNLKPLKVSDKNTPIQISEDTVDVKGSLKVNGVDVSTEPDDDTDTGATELNELSDVTYSSGDLTISSLDKIIASGDLTLDAGTDIKLDAAGDNIEFLDNGTKYGEVTSTGGKSSLILYENAGASTDDFLSIVTQTNGATSINTTDDNAEAGHLTLNIDGDIILDSHTGNFVAKKAGTEFSVANSAYAGMILGYTRIQDNSTTPSTDYITINSSSMTVLQTAAGTNLSINFIVPPSGNVEIDCRFWVSAVSDGAKFSLSTGTSYAELDEKHTYDADYTFFLDETDHYVVNVTFAVTGLTAGTDTTYYLAGLASGAATYIRHGRFRTAGSHSPPIILKATALPATITTGE